MKIIIKLKGLEGAPEDIVIYKNIFLLSVRDTMTMWFKGVNNAILIGNMDEK